MTPRCPLPARVLALALAATVAAVAADGAVVPEQAYQGLEWRLVGPLRAGWSSCAAGVPGQPDTFYFGAVDGGVWKTTDAGHTWQPLFDHEADQSVGALAVAPSDPRVLYVGTGQVAPRWDVVSGAGVYRSGDGGKTWERRGLADSRHIGRIWVDPRNADTLLVAALGHFFGPSEERGVFRSTDGGKTWQKVLYQDTDTGAVDLAADPSTPDVVYAALWQARRYPWQAYFTPIAGPGSGIWKSTDGGKTWARLGAGLPDGPVGRIGLAVAPGSGGERVYAVVDAEATNPWEKPASPKSRSGLYRTDDGGAHWQQVNDDASLADWYFGRVTADPWSPDTVYVMGRSVRRSTDGGKTFTITKGSPGGDDYHFLWISAEDPGHMILASDQGTTVSVNGGRTWSSWYNQPTGQFYGLAADERFPYWIYSGQQDSGTVAIASRSDYGQLTFRDWHPVGADERDHEVPEPGNPDVVYGSGLGGRLSRWDAKTGQVQNVSPWPVSSYGARPTDVRYRYTWITPLTVSPLPPHALYLAAQVLFRSSDGGQTWQAISPDLTGTVPGAKGCARDVPVERARACGYGVIFAIAPSPVVADEVWVGTDSGLVQLTQDGGRTWENVTPPGLGDWSRVAAIDASATDAATAYVAVDRHRLDDLRPYVYRTHDHGRTWTEVGHGLPDGAPVYVVRQDTVRPGLLFAGTTRGVFVSMDDGERWQALQSGLPTSGVNDLLVHGNDLIAATQGRAIWVLDDITPLRHLDPEATAPQLIPPATAFRVRGNENRDTPLPPDEPTAPNPPAGAILDYVLPATPSAPVTLEIADPQGEVVARFRSDDEPSRPKAERYFAAEWQQPLAPLPARPGHNRFVWDLRYPRPPAPEYEYSIAAVPGVDTPALPRGALVVPGRYEVRLTIGGQTLRQPLTVALDPRVDTKPAALEALLAFQKEVGAELERVTSADARARSLAERLETARTELESRPKARAARAAAERLANELGQLRKGTSEDNLAAIGGALTALATDLEGADRAPTAPQRQVLTVYRQHLEHALARWEALQASEVRETDRKLRAAGLPALVD
jgi:photosystem II stability/assembly factor-like uncharacterized protein